MEDENSALIARLLAEDNQYAAATGYGGFSSEEDDGEDEGYRRKKKRKKSTKTVKKRVTALKKKEDTPVFTADGKKVRAKPKRWTPEEEVKFLQALELYGRDWAACAEYLETERKPRDVASHAQKHFIKLYREDRPLPDKVRESGEGYTLSGKPLDPNSAAARAYGIKGKEGSRAYRKEIAGADGQPSSVDAENNPSKNNEEAKTDTTPKVPPQKTEDSESNVEEKAVEKNDATAEGHTSPVDAKVDFDKLSNRERNDLLLAQAKAEGMKLGQVVDKSQRRSTRVDSSGASGLTGAELEAHRVEAAKARELREQERKKKETEKKQELWRKQQEKQEELYGDDGRTEYSRNRSRRRAATRFVAAPTNALQFVPLSQYIDAPVSGPKSQPFHVKVHSSVYAIVDLHSHMSTCEVIGFLAGRWDRKTRTITVLDAFPGRSLLDGQTECEMDPVEEVKLRDEIAKLGLTCLGWYHSHPTFAPNPSSCDVDNQANYQALFRDGSMEPFIGLINTPYDLCLPSQRSQFSWFYVDSPTVSKNAKRVEPVLVCDTSLSSAVKERMEGLVANKDESSASAVNFTEQWRGSSYSSKLETSLTYWVPPVVFSLTDDQEITPEEQKKHDEIPFVKKLIRILRGEEEPK